MNASETILSIFFSFCTSIRLEPVFVEIERQARRFVFAYTISMTIVPSTFGVN